VATAFGVVLALDPRVATISLGVWIVTLLFWKRAGAASLAAASSLLPATLFLSPDRPLRLLLLLLFTFFIFLRHEKNLDELLPPLP
ncbi:MAG: glycerol-3-phosphate acyltransferase, partial [Deltaproteobacteria bacterium]